VRTSDAGARVPDEVNADRPRLAGREIARHLTRRKPETELGLDRELLVVEKLCRRFGAHEVVRSLDLTASAGERIALRGPNGSGKTTVLRCIAGTVTATGGRIAVGGHPAGTHEARRLIGASFSQERSFYLRLSGRDNLVFFARLRHRRRSEAVRAVGALEEELELDEIVRERVDRCSTGMIQQLAFARALLGEPRLLLLDEPTRSLDDDALERLWGALDRRRERVSVVIATHRADDVERCESRVDLPA
jgi:ABC-type multidrug transport system ATPase subunit